MAVLRPKPDEISSSFETFVRDATQAATQPRAVGYPTVTVVIPALNEAQNLPYVLPKLAGLVDEVIIVDGLSDDDTIEVARRLDSEVRIIEEPTRGKGAALRRGFAEARGDIIVALDAPPLLTRSYPRLCKMVLKLSPPAFTYRKPIAVTIV